MKKALLPLGTLGLVGATSLGVLGLNAPAAADETDAFVKREDKATSLVLAADDDDDDTSTSIDTLFGLTTTLDSLSISDASDACEYLQPASSDSLAYRSHANVVAGQVCHLDYIHSLTSLPSPLPSSPLLSL